MYRFLLVLLFTLFSSNASVAQTFDHSEWTSLLSQNVHMVNGGKSSQVDYDGFVKDRAKLETYRNNLAKITQDEFDEWLKPDQLAFLINAYNAWTIELVLTGYPDIESVRDLGNFIFTAFGKDIVSLIGNKISLDDIEKGLILRSDRYNESRVHFALNCASISCPALRPEAYDGSQLEKQLNEQMHNFLSDKEKNYLDDNQLRVSTIFKWYRSDFEKSDENIDNLKEYFTKHVSLLSLSDEEIDIVKSGDFRIRFLSYDWNLNRTF